MHTDLLFERVLEAFQGGDLDEAIRRTRALVFAAPLHPGPRHMLAVLYGITGRARLAVTQYRSLLPQALENGELFRAVAIRKRMDELDPTEAAIENRWDMVRRGLRSRGFPDASTQGQPWADAQALAVTGPWFERIIAEARVHTLARHPRPEDFEAPVIWYVLSGRTRWSATPLNEGAGSEGTAREGDTIRVAAGPVRVEMAPELPVECLRFDAPLTRAFQAMLDQQRRAYDGASDPSVQTRTQIPVLPRRHSDLDERAPGAPCVQGGGPPRLSIEPPSSSAPKDGHDLAEWPASGHLSLPDFAEAPIVKGSASVDPEGPAQPSSPAAVSPSAEPVPPPAPAGLNWFGNLLHDVSRMLERRRHNRVPVSIQSQMALVRLRDSRVGPVHGEICDLSLSGLGVRLTAAALGASRGALANAVVSVELGLTGPEGPLQIAGHVRRIDVNDALNEVKIGIEFVLLTDPDKVRLERAMAAGRAASGTSARSETPGTSR